MTFIEAEGMRKIVRDYSSEDLAWIIRKLEAMDPRDNPRWRGIPLSIFRDERDNRIQELRDTEEGC